MDWSHFNWGFYALGVIALLLVVWGIERVRYRPPVWAVIVSFAHLFVAGLCSVAPLRGFVDSNYVGFRFGYVHTVAGLDTAIVAGLVFTSAVIAALIAVRNRPGFGMWFVTLTSAFFAINLGGSWLQTTMTDMSQNAIQLGEYLTVPGLAGTAVMFVLFVCPFLIGTGWGPARARA